MGKIVKRILSINLPEHQSAFLWGPRKVGKSYWINHNLKNVILIDLLKTDVFADFISRPALLRERYQNTKKMIVIDEVQMVPDLLNEVHWLIENKKIPFLLCGSSARKLRRKHSNLLGGRAWRHTMTPLSYLEVSDFNLENTMISGLLPPHFLSHDSIQDLRAYIADYLKEEIAAESVIQNIPAFSQFLKVCALTSGEILNYTNIARESGISAKVVRNYFQILEDTLLGYRIQAWKKSQTRKLLETEKFYLFDVGVANYLARQKPVFGTREFGKSFEHFILMELKTYQAYKNPELEIYYWRSANGPEIDFILNNMETAIEIKAKKMVHAIDLKPMKILNNEYKIKNKIIVTCEQEPRFLDDDITVLPWKTFLENLWQGKYTS